MPIPVNGKLYVAIIKFIAMLVIAIHAWNNVKTYQGSYFLMKTEYEVF